MKSPHNQGVKWGFIGIPNSNAIASYYNIIKVHVNGIKKSPLRVLVKKKYTLYLLYSVFNNYHCTKNYKCT